MHQMNVLIMVRIMNSKQLKRSIYLVISSQAMYSDASAVT